MNKKIIIALFAGVILAICCYLLFRNQNNRDEYVNPDDSGILEVGLQNDKDDKESDTEQKEETQNHDNNSNKPSNSTDLTEKTEIPAGGEAVDAGDGSVNIVMNDDEEAFGE